MLLPTWQGVHHEQQFLDFQKKKKQYFVGWVLLIILVHETTHTPTCDGIHEIVDAKNVVARLDQLQHRVAADKTRRARHQNFHSWKNVVKLWNPSKSR